MWIETLEVYTPSDAFEISSLIKKRCGLKLSKKRWMKHLTRFHLWLKRDVDWNRQICCRRNAWRGFHLWLKRDVDWNACWIRFPLSSRFHLWLKRDVDWNFVSPFSPRMSVEAFHLWLKRDVDWNLKPTGTAFINLGFHLWLKRDVDWNGWFLLNAGCTWSISSLIKKRCGLKPAVDSQTYRAAPFHLWLKRDVDWNFQYPVERS